MTPIEPAFGPPRSRKVLLVGWDAADWKVIQPLMDAGKMPALQSIVEGGASGALASLDPPLSPILWTSIATGMTADKHGVLGFTQPRADGAGVEPVLASSRRVKALWNILMQTGLRTHVIGWWPSHPAERLNGVSLSNFYHHMRGPLDDPAPMPPGTVHPEHLIDTLEALRIHPQELTAEHILPFVPDAAAVDPRRDRRLSSVARITAECATVQAAATWVMRNEPWDFMAVYFDAIDHYCHGFMKYHPPWREGVPQELYERYRGVVEGGYRLHDMMLARLLELAGPETTVILCSDHGFHSDHLRPTAIPSEPAGPAVEHRPYGVLAMKGPGIKRDALLFGASLLDIAPTILAHYGLPAGEDMDGKVLADAFEEAAVPERIASWESVAGEDGRRAEGEPIDPWAERAALDQLVALGYIDPPEEDAAAAIAACRREADYYLARVYLHTSRPERAVPLLETLLRRHPDQTRFGLRLANAYLELGQVAEARRVTDTTLQAWEARTLEQNGEGNPSILGSLTLEALRARHRPALDLLQGSLLFAEGDDAGALAHLERARRADRRLPGLQLRLGRLYLRMGRLQDAEEAFFELLESDPDSAEAYDGLARVYLRGGHARDAAEAAAASLGLRFHNPAAHCHLGMARRQLGEFAAAEIALRNALAQAPGLAMAHRELVQLYRHSFNDPLKAAAHQRHIDQGIIDFDAYRERHPVPVESPAPPSVMVEGEGRRTIDAPAEAVVVVVSGLPRSGTSMMMQMLAAGGVEPLSDRRRGADAHNPRGYFELEAVKRLGREPAEWFARAPGRAVKVVAPLLDRLPDDHPCRVILMRRPMEELLASQRRMLGVREGPFDAELLERSFEGQFERARVLLERRPRTEWLLVDYHQALDEPLRVARRVARFIHRPFDVAAAAAAVDPALHRQRAGRSRATSSAQPA